MALCLQIDVERRLLRTFTNQPEPVITDLIASAQGHIEKEVGYEIESDAGIIEKFDGEYQTTLFTARRPLTAIASITEDGTALVATDYVFYSDGRIVRVAGGYSTRWLTGKRQAIVVNHTAGYAIVPEDLKDLCARMAAAGYRAGVTAAATAETGAAGIKSVSLEGSDSVTYADAAENVTAGLFGDPELWASFDRVVARYRTPAIA